MPAVRSSARQGLFISSAIYSAGPHGRLVAIPRRTAMTETASVRFFRIQDLPLEDRPRERLARLGPGALSSEELLALLLVSGSRGESALDRARRLLATHGGLAGLAGLSEAELARERGIKGARAA